MTTASGAAQGSPLPAELARPWPRFWARFLDQQLYLIPLGVVAVLLFPGVMTNDLFAGRTGDMLLSFLLLPFAMIWDALFIALFGTTVGKALVGLRVAGTDGRRLAMDRALRRSFLLYFRGIIMGLPLIWLMGAASARDQLEKDGHTSWDLATDSHVYAIGSRVERTAAVAVVAIVIMGAMQTLSRMADSGY